MAEPESVRSETAPMRIAADLRWRQPSRTWGDIAKEVGVDERTIRRWRQTEEWEITFRAAGSEYIERLAPAAVSALVASWAKGNAHGALETLRSFGFLRDEHIEITRTPTEDEVIALRDKLLDRSQQ